MKVNISMAIRRLLVSSVALVVWGCGSGADEPSTSEQPRLAAVDSLLGPPYEISSASIRFHPPRAFAKAPDSLFKLFKTQMAINVRPHTKIELVGCFLDTVHAGVLLVSVIEKRDLSKDTIALFARYRQSLYDLFGRDRVREREYWQNHIFIKNFKITDSTSVRCQLLCLTDKGEGEGEGDAAELIYSAPRFFYSRLAAAIESSIGSIQHTQKGR